MELLMHDIITALLIVIVFGVFMFNFGRFVEKEKGDKNVQGK